MSPYDDRQTARPSRVRVAWCAIERRVHALQERVTHGEALAVLRLRIVHLEDQLRQAEARNGALLDEVSQQHEAYTEALGADIGHEIEEFLRQHPSTGGEAS